MIGEEERQFSVIENFNPADMQALMRHETIYWSATDALAPQPQQADFIARIVHPQTWTLAACFGTAVVGYIQFIRRTSVMAEIHVGFLPPFRGQFAKAAIQWSIYRAFKEKGLTKLLGLIPSDNRAAIMLARRLGFKVEGRLTKAMVRTVEGQGQVRDIVMLSLNKNGDY